jgi:hypothetical protein
MTEEEIEAAIRDAHYQLADCMPPRALGYDVEREERSDLFWLAEGLLDDGYGLLLLAWKDADAHRDWQADWQGANRDWLVSEALTGSRLAHDALCHIAAGLTSTEKLAPLWLQRYLVRAASRGPQRAKRGRNSKTNLERDQVIAWAIYYISRRYTLHPTRNAATGTECGCSIVAKALRRPELYIAMSEPAVAAIWRRMGPFIERMPPPSILLPSRVLLANKAMLAAHQETLNAAARCKRPPPSRQKVRHRNRRKHHARSGKP